MKLLVLSLLFVSSLAGAAWTQSPHSGMGAIPVEGGVSFRGWAPNAEMMHVRGVFNDWALSDPLTLEGSTGMWSAVIPSASVGDSYKFFVTNTDPTPPNGTTAWRRDPYSRKLDYFVAVDANSVVYDSGTYVWDTSVDFPKPALDELVIYEMHIGSYNAPTHLPATFQQAVARLDHLVSLGVNAVEIMPLHENPGSNGWGYNATLFYAIEDEFGGADGFKLFVDECHARGLAVLIDVIYNHAYPNDNDMINFDLASEGVGGGIWFYNDAANANTPWGPRFNFARQPVRDFVVNNVRMYLEEFRVDGFRFDATAFLRYGNEGEAPGAVSLLQEINTMVARDFPGTIMIAEDYSDDRLATKPVAQGGLGFHTEWDRFSEHVARILSAATDGERDLTDLRNGLMRTLNGDPFRRVIFAESHDTAAPEDAPWLVLPYRGAYLPRRINDVDPETNLTTRRLALLGSVLTMTSRGVPMIFMGQELYETGVFEYPSPDAWDWDAQYASHSGIIELHRDLISLRRNTDQVSAGLRGGAINVHHQNNTAKVIAYVRSGSDPDQPGNDVLVVINFSGTNFPLGYLIGAPREGRWHVHLNSESQQYDPAFSMTAYEWTHSDAGPSARDGLAATLTIPRLAPYSAAILSQAVGQKPAGFLIY